jgi:hypothetical protein
LEESEGSPPTRIMPAFKLPENTFETVSVVDDTVAFKVVEM